jgi:hypothetical protein
MKIEFRPTTPRDSTAIARLLQSVFQVPGNSPLLDPANMHWKYWASYPGWEGSRSYVLERDEQIVAHGAVAPQVCLWAGQRFPAIHLIDWAADPDAPGTGVSLFQQLLRTTNAGYCAGGSRQTRRLLPAMGFRDFGVVTRYVRPLKPWRRWKEAAQSPRNILFIRNLARLGRGLLWAMTAPAPHADGFASREVPAAGLQKIAWPRPHSEADTVVLERTPELMAHFLASPRAAMTFHVVERGGRVCGYFLLAFTPGQARIVDCLMEVGPGEDADAAWRGLYLTAVAEAGKHQDVWEVVTVASPGVFQQSLRQAGFHARGEIPLRFYSKAPLLDDAAALRFQMLDSDAAYLNSGSSEFWG